VIVLLLNTRTGTSLGVASFVVLGATVVVGATMFGCTGALVGAVVVSTVLVMGGAVGDGLSVVAAVEGTVVVDEGVGGGVALLGGGAALSLDPEPAVTTPTPIRPTATATRPTPSTRSGGRGPPGAGRLT